jgi:hypothetical protein
MIIPQPFSQMSSYAYSFLLSRMREERVANDHPPTLFTAVFLCKLILFTDRMREEREEERLQGPRPQSSYTSHNPDPTRQSSVQEVRP